MMQIDWFKYSFEDRWGLAAKPPAEKIFEYFDLIDDFETCGDYDPSAPLVMPLIMSIEQFASFFQAESLG